METKLLKIKSQDDGGAIAQAAALLRGGRLVAIPTETVYGLAANALDAAAVAKIFDAKGRPQDNPLIVHISSIEELEPLVKSVPDRAIALAEAFWPGPLTMIFERSDIIPDDVSCGLPSVAVRMPSHPVARAIIRAAGVPLAAPSANTSGKPSPTTAAHVLHDMNGRIDAIVDGGECEVGVESTVITLCTQPPTLLRPGGITLEQLRATIGEVRADPALFSELPEGVRPSSPGMKYKHYSPEAEVTVIRGSLESFIKYISDHSSAATAAVCFDGEENEIKKAASLVYCYGRENDAQQQAHRLFAILRDIDDAGVSQAFVRCPSTDGVGMAVYNRLLRAAAFKVIDLTQSR